MAALKNIAILVSLVALILGGTEVWIIYSKQTRSEGQETFSSRTYSYPTLGFRVAVPTSWTVAEKMELKGDNYNAPDIEATREGAPPPESLTVGLDKQTISFLSSASVSISVAIPDSQPVVMTLERGVLNRIAGVEYMAKNFDEHVKILEPKTEPAYELRQVDMAGVRAYKTVLKEGYGQNNDIFLRTTFYDFEVGRHRYVLAIKVPKNDESKFGDDISTIVRSIRLIPATEPTTIPTPPIAGVRGQAANDRSGEHLWRTGEFEAGQERDRSNLSPRVLVKKTIHEIRLKPPFYNGVMPVTFNRTSIEFPLGDSRFGELTLSEESPLGYVIYYFYGNLDIAKYLLPTGARAIDPKSGRVLAEARLIESYLGSMNLPYMIIMEAHYDSGGTATFRSRSFFSKSSFRFKERENDITGKKQQEFFLWWPEDNYRTDFSVQVR